MSADLKYQDRDVRDHPGYWKVAREYLRQYTGEFSFLVDMKMRDADGQELSVGHVRGILNCMRVDPRVDVPDPEDLPKVKKNKKRKNKKRKKGRLALVVPIKAKEFVEKVQTYEYPEHTVRVPRWPLQWSARFHAPYLRSRSSNLIHRSSHNGIIFWSHAEPYRMEVRTVCKPKLVNPIQLDAQGVLRAEPWPDPKPYVTHLTITLCSKCFPTGEIA